MTFEEAVKGLEIEDRADIELIIRFKDRNGRGWATLSAIKPFKNKEDAIKTLGTAWGYCIKERPEREGNVLLVECRAKVQTQSNHQKIA